MQTFDFASVSTRVTTSAVQEKQESSFYSLTSGLTPPHQRQRFSQFCFQSRSQSVIMEDVWTAAVKAHNQYRRNHGVPDVMGCREMHEEAQKHAEHLAATNTFELSKNAKFIGNLASSFRLNEEDAVREAIKRWYSTVQHYHWNKPGFQVNSGSFSAVVWKNVTHIGVGIAWNENAASYVIVVYYDPAPNVCQEFRENVLRPVRINL